MANGSPATSSVSSTVDRAGQRRRRLAACTPLHHPTHADQPPHRACVTHGDVVEGDHRATHHRTHHTETIRGKQRHQRVEAPTGIQPERAHDATPRCGPAVHRLERHRFTTPASRARRARRGADPASRRNARIDMGASGSVTTPKVTKFARSAQSHRSRHWQFTADTPRRAVGCPPRVPSRGWMIGHARRVSCGSIEGLAASTVRPATTRPPAAAAVASHMAADVGASRSPTPAR